MPARPTHNPPLVPAGREPGAHHTDALMRLAAHLALRAGGSSPLGLRAALETAGLGWGSPQVALWAIDEEGRIEEVASWPGPLGHAGVRLPASVLSALRRGGASPWPLPGGPPALASAQPPGGPGAAHTTWRPAPREVWLMPVRRGAKPGAELLGALVSDRPPRSLGTARDDPWMDVLSEPFAGVLGHPMTNAARPSDPSPAAGTGTAPSEGPGPPPVAGGRGNELVLRWDARGRLLHASEAARHLLGEGPHLRLDAATLGASPDAVSVALAGSPREASTSTEVWLSRGRWVRWTHVVGAPTPGGGHEIISVGHELRASDRALGNLEAAWAAVRAASARAIDAEERVRREVGSELHDVAAQHLTAALLRLQLLASEDEPAAGELTSYTAALRETAAEIEDGIRALRSASRAMAAHTLQTQGLAPALAELAERLTRWHGVPCTFTERGAPHPLPPATALAAFRGAAELLANVARHAHAQRCDLVLHWQAQGALVEVIDDGVGLCAHQPTSPPEAPEALHLGDVGLGLFTVRARLREVGGGLQLGASRAGGTRAVLFVPARGRDEEGESHDDPGPDR